MRSACLLVVFVAALVGCNPAAEQQQRAEQEQRTEQEPPSSTKPAPAPAPITTTINQFLGRGVPTYVLGTAGDDAADRAIAAQAELIRAMVFPSAEVLRDTSVIERAAWPEHAVVYGGPHVSQLLAELELPFQLTAGRLQIGEQTFEGDDYQLIAVVPAGAHNPEFLLYAGTGTPGIAEINAVRHGPESILVIDAFGRLATGAWVRTGDRIEAKLAAPARRIEWRTSEHAVANVTARISFAKQLAPDADEAAQIEALTRGIASAVEHLAITEPLAIDVYVYPDRRSKQSLTGNEGDGHAVPMARALHVLRHNPAPGGALERLVAHEATHVLAYESWGAAGTVLLGEGLAVYVSGQYGGATLEQVGAAYRCDTTDQRVARAWLSQATGGGHVSDRRIVGGRGDRAGWARAGACASLRSDGPGLGCGVRARGDQRRGARPSDRQVGSRCTLQRLLAIHLGQDRRVGSSRWIAAALPAAAGCRGSDQPSEARVTIESELVEQVSRGTLVHAESELARIEAELQLGRMSEQVEVHVVDPERIGEYCPEDEPLCVVQPPRRIYVSAERYGGVITRELVRDQLARSSVGSTKPMFSEGVATVLTRPTCTARSTWEPPGADSLLSKTLGTSLNTGELYLAGELLRWLLDTHGPDVVLEFMATLDRSDLPEEVRLAYLERFGSSIDIDLYAHWRPADEEISPARAGCVGVEIERDPTRPRMRLEASFRLRQSAGAQCLSGSFARVRRVDLDDR